MSDMSPLERQYRAVAAIQKVLEAADALRRAQHAVIAAQREAAGAGLPTSIYVQLRALSDLLYADDVTVNRTGDGTAFRLNNLVLAMGAAGHDATGDRQ